MEFATHVYEDALEEAPGTIETGLKASVEAIKDGDLEVAAALLRATAKHCEKHENEETNQNE